MNELPPPPALIKINSDLSSGIDLRDPVHAKAYLSAAGHFLSSWPQDWSAERLALALLVDEEDHSKPAFEDQKKVLVVEYIVREAKINNEGEHWFAEDLISCLAENIIEFVSQVIADHQ